MRGSETIAVIGAGPAGCAAALALRRKGVPVVLADRATFPRPKVCGDMLVPGALEEIERLGLPLADLRERTVDCLGARFVSPRGAEFSDTFRDRGQARPCWTASRSVIDAWLLEQARRAGAEVRESVEAKDVVRDAAGRVLGVVLRRADGRTEELPCRQLIAADGAGSPIAASLGLPKVGDGHLAYAMRGYVRGIREAFQAQKARHLEIFTHAAILPGCAWIVPVGNGVYNVGLGVLAARNPSDLTPKKLFEKVRAEVPKLAERLEGAVFEASQGWFLPIATARRPVAGPGWLLAGDAAALIDPLTGHGIHNALHSGRLAGETVAAGMAETGDQGAVAERYRRRLDRELRPAMRASMRLRRFSQYAPLAELLTQAARAASPIRRWLVGAIGHSYPQLDKQ
jgi:geranylgeranyl reductase family protein